MPDAIEPNATAGPDATPVATPKYVPPSQLAPTLDGAGLLAEAEKRKEKANEYFGMGLFEPAMQSYLTAIWYLKVARPDYPEVLSEQMPPSETAATKYLGDGMPPRTQAKAPVETADQRVQRRLGYFIYSMGSAWLVALVAVISNAALAFGASVEAVVASIVALGVLGLWIGRWLWRASNEPQKLTSAEEAAAVLEGKEARALRLTLHLNVAACALKRKDWYLAREAAQIVLKSDAEHPKALYRLAQAWDGVGDLKEAGRTLSSLLKVQGQRDNREARRLLADVQERRQRERAMFNGVCNKKGFCQTEEEAAAMEERDAWVKRTKPKDALTQRFDAYAEYEKRRKLGLQWEDVGHKRPANGTELTNWQLAEALRKKKTLTFVELDNFGVEDLQPGHYIMVDGRCFEPRERDWQPSIEDEGEGNKMGMVGGEVPDATPAETKATQPSET